MIQASTFRIFVFLNLFVSPEALLLGQREGWTLSTCSEKTFVEHWCMYVMSEICLEKNNFILYLCGPALSCSEQFTTKLVKLHNLQSLFASIHPAEVKDRGRHLQLCRNRIKRPSPNRSQLTTSPTSLVMSSDEILKQPWLLHFYLASSQILLIVLFLQLKIGLGSAVPPVLRHSD